MSTPVWEPPFAGTETELALGLNLFAVLCCGLLFRHYRRERERAALDADDAAIRAAIRNDNAGFG